MKIFVSSTVFDLIDVRAEILALLTSMGMDAVMSDESLSSFEVVPNVNSIETCLSNVRQCDEFLLILDRRYGSSLGRFGFDDLSATHLEYSEARKHGKNIHFFVRDRLDADYAVWKRNKKKLESTTFPWVGPKDVRLFDLLSEHAALNNDSPTSNWYTPFRSSVDLKAAVEQRLRLKNVKRMLNEDIRNNRFPFFDYSATCAPLSSRGSSGFKLDAIFTNVGTVPAFEVTCKWKDELSDTSECNHATIVPPGSRIACPQRLAKPGILAQGVDTSVSFTFKTGTGVAVSEEYSFGFRASNHGGFLCGGILLKRIFHPTTNIDFELADPPSET